MISVVMGFFNAASTVKKAVKSVIDGYEGEMEIILCDDASTDGSAEEILSLNDNRITLIRNTENKGLGYCLRECVKLARGEYIVRMDADDVSLEGRIAKQIAFLEEHKEIAFCGTGAYLSYEGKRWGKRAYPPFPDVKVLLKRNPFIHPTVVFRKSALIAAGNYSADRKYLRCEDYELFFRMYAHGERGANLEEFLLEYEEAPFSKGKHTFSTRLNECRVRRKGGKMLKAGLKGFLMSFYPVALYFLPHSIYKKLRFRMWAD